MQERQFDRPILGEQGGGVLAARDGGEEFDQQGLGVFHCDVLVLKRLQAQVTIEWASNLAPAPGPKAPSLQRASS
jgi:hypothetical protein